MIDNGNEGLQAIQDNEYDLILLDIAMPEFTGLDIINSLKKDGILESRNIVVLTASSDKGILDELGSSGVKGILNKPCSLEELDELIQKWK